MRPSFALSRIARSEEMIGVVVVVVECLCLQRLKDTNIGPAALAEERRGEESNRTIQSNNIIITNTQTVTTQH